LSAPFATLTALNRIAFGAHFVSDVLIATGLMATLAIGLAQLIYGRPGVQSCDTRLDAALGARHRDRATRLKCAASRIRPLPPAGEVRSGGRRPKIDPVDRFQSTEA
jgi:hypothetical protein